MTKCKRIIIFGVCLNYVCFRKNGQNFNHGWSQRYGAGVSSFVAVPFLQIVLFLTCFMFYAPLDNIRICEYSPLHPPDDVTFGKMSGGLGKISSSGPKTYFVYIPPANPPWWRHIREFLDVVNMKEIWRNMWNIWRNILCQKFERIYRKYVRICGKYVRICGKYEGICQNM